MVKAREPKARLPEWIPVRVDLVDDEAVCGMASILGVNPYEVVGRLVSLWGRLSQQSADGFVRFVSASYADRLAQLDGFGAAMCTVGWLVECHEGGIEFPNFERWLGRGAKRRLTETLRKQASRKETPQSASANCPQNVRNSSAQHADKKRPTQTETDSLSDCLTQTDRALPDCLPLESANPEALASALADRGVDPPGVRRLTKTKPTALIQAAIGHFDAKRAAGAAIKAPGLVNMIDDPAKWDIIQDAAGNWSTAAKRERDAWDEQTARDREEIKRIHEEDERNRKRDKINFTAAVKGGAA